MGHLLGLLGCSSRTVSILPVLVTAMSPVPQFSVHGVPQILVHMWEEGKISSGTRECTNATAELKFGKS